MKPSFIARGCVAVLGIALLLSACRTDQTSPTDPLVAKVAALGFRGDMIQDMGDYFLVEGDIQISKQSLQQSTNFPRPEFQWVTNVLVGSTQVQNIVVDLSGLSSQPSWQTAARSALTEWNKVTCSSVTLIEGSPADITFGTVSEPSNPGLAARATFPLDAPTGSGKPGPSIVVNTAYTGTPNNSSTQLRNMVHEIGHTIGFRHTNWQARREDLSPDHETYGANLVSGTPATDDASVMNGGTATVGWGGFSTYDVVAAQQVYPGGPCIPPISGSATMMPGNTCYYYASASGGSAPYTFTWSWSGTASVGGYSPSNGVFLLAAQGTPGYVNLTVNVTDALGPFGSTVKNITVSSMGPSCY